MKMIYKSLVACMAMGASLNASALNTVELVEVIHTGNKKGDEIISVQSFSKQFAVSNSQRGSVDIYSIATPGQPVKKQSHSLSLAEGEQLTSVAMHPEYAYFMAAIQGAGPSTAGRVQLHDIDSGKLLASLPTGIGPDAVVIDPTGRYAMLPNEAEAFIFHPKDETFSSPEGSLTLVKLAASADQSEAIQIALPDLTGKPGFVSADDKRFIEREIDWNGDGKITEEDVDLDNNGTISENKMTVGTFRGESVRVEEEDGEMFLFPLVDNKPDLLEPEYPAFSADGNQVWVSLQENNGMLLVDTQSATIVDSFGLGTTTHAADLEDNQNVDFSQTLTALREPDGITVSHDGRFLLTADEGDTDPKASKTKKGPAGGGRTLSVFDSTNGQFIADTGNQIDQMAHNKGLYPESRSDNKGSEPEMLVSFSHDDIDYVAIGLERANAVALVSLQDPNQPKVLDISAIDADAEDGKVAPEGIAHYYDTNSGLHYIYTANEKDGTLAVFQIR